MLVARFKRKGKTEIERNLVWPRWLSARRQKIKTIFSQLVARYQMKVVWARDTWHFCLTLCAQDLESHHGCGVLPQGRGGLRLGSLSCSPTTSENLHIGLFAIVHSGVRRLSLRRRPVAAKHSRGPSAPLWGSSSTAWGDSRASEVVISSLSPEQTSPQKPLERWVSSSERRRSRTSCVRAHKHPSNASPYPGEISLSPASLAYRGGAVRTLAQRRG